MEKEEIFLDVTGCKSVARLHEKIRDTFCFPEYYGANLDALWDMGLDYIGANRAIFTHIKIEGVQTLPEDARDYFLKKIMPVFREIQEQRGNIQFEMEKGKT